MSNNVPPRRKESRASGNRTGVIKLGMFKQIECDITDFSVSGAKLSGPDVANLPENFDMTVHGSGKKRKYECLKRWQRGDTIGVEFITE